VLSRDSSRGTWRHYPLKLQKSLLSFLRLSTLRGHPHGSCHGALNVGPGVSWRMSRTAPDTKSNQLLTSSTWLHELMLTILKTCLKEKDLKSICLLSSQDSSWFICSSHVSNAMSTAPQGASGPAVSAMSTLAAGAWDARSTPRSRVPVRWVQPVQSFLVETLKRWSWWELMEISHISSYVIQIWAHVSVHMRQKGAERKGWIGCYRTTNILLVQTIRSVQLFTVRWMLSLFQSSCIRFCDANACISIIWPK